MPEYRCWDFPEMPPEIAELLLQNDQKLVIIGVIGKSAFPDANKMVAFNVLDRHPSLLEHKPMEGQIQFYYKPKESMLFLHFETSYDTACMQQMLDSEMAERKFGEFMLFNQHIKSRFARMLMFAIHVCHIVVFVELNVNFDASLLALFKAMKIIRDRHVYKFLPKLIKNSTTGAVLGKHARLCSPRFLFLFENYPDGYEKTKEAISKLEFEVEDNIYKMLRNEHIVTSNSSMSLFSIPGNKRFVYYNTNENLREDPLLKSVAHLETLIQKTSIINDDDDDLEDLRPYRGFGAPIIRCKPVTKQATEEETFLKQRQFMDLIKEHVEEALTAGFDDNLTRYKGKTHFTVLTAKAWFDIFKMLHKIFIQNPGNPEFEANDPDYKSYLENFDQILNLDNEFFNSCCDIGLQKAFAMYNNPKLTHYSGAVHKKLVEEAVALYLKFARGPYKANNEAKLREMCESCWQKGKQQCETPSLRCYPCILPKHIVQDPTEHSSGNVFVSTCNCGRSQGRREDPYTIRQANYEFYEFMASNCNLCMKVKKINFAVFEPSSSDYRAAEVEITFPRLYLQDTISKMEKITLLQANDDLALNANSQPLTASQGTRTNLSLESINELDKIESENIENSSDEETFNELILQLKDEAERENPNNISRQVSTTEYLRGMVHTETPPGLLPQFPSWSLCNVGSSSVYSHNTGLLEHYQSGFLPGANFLLPWDVQVRLEHSASWAYEKARYRKMGEVFVLKIFVGFEYECPRGNRFMLSAPDKILRGASGILRDSGSKVVFNNMPLYYNCPCRTEKPYVAQLMRVHVVTPKAPVNVILDPKIRTGNEHKFEFTLGLPSPPKLSQSAYWILRLPYIYQGDEGPIAPPTELNAANAMTYGYLKAGMFGVSETELDE